jgi:hypothetical protein
MNSIALKKEIYIAACIAFGWRFNAQPLCLSIFNGATIAGAAEMLLRSYARHILN